MLLRVALSNREAAFPHINSSVTIRSESLPSFSSLLSILTWRTTIIR